MSNQNSQRVEFFRVIASDLYLGELTTKRFFLLEDGNVQEKYLPSDHNAKWTEGRTWRPGEVEILILADQKDTESAHSLLQEAHAKGLGLGKASTYILETHLRHNPSRNEQSDQKMLDTLIHSISHTTGAFLTPHHLIWRDKAKTNKKFSNREKIMEKTRETS